MKIATYVPFDEKKRVCPVRGFKAETVEDLVLGSLLFKGKLPEMLVVFDTDNYRDIVDDEYPVDKVEVDSLPEDGYYLQVGEVVNADAFICDNLQREAFPEEQANKRTKCMLTIKTTPDVEKSYETFLDVQREAFSQYLLPMWAPFILSAIDGIQRTIDLDSCINIGDKNKLEHMIKNKRSKEDIYQALKNAMYGWDLSPNDKCYCGSGKKFKKCCGRV